MNTKLNRSLIAVAVLAALGTTANAAETFSGKAQDAWLTGKVETVFTLNRHLNPFAIDTDVVDGVVHLTGNVERDVDRELAGALAKGVEGVIEVDNDLVVGSASDEKHAASDTERRDFGTWVDDATTTAAVKSRLIANPETKGLQIDVDTNDDVVTLSGRVKTDAERDLAEQVARNSRDVADVHNNLVVDPS